ncbi:MAG TPA: RNA methyltransferase [Tepidisphaeraceae bacterium]|nr:RNA methyltransferase [Tepidisphaeraceae bacterium]
MPLVDSLDDPRLALYRNLKDHELARQGGRFIAEGEQVVRRLLASDIRVESVLVSQRKAEIIAPLVSADVPVWIASDAVIQKVIGFQFHSGVMAVGVRPAPADLSTIVGRPGDRQTLVVCPKITNTQNLGSLIRLCAGFGVDGLVLGPSCCDPFYRHCVRISMGSVFRLPITRSSDLHRDLLDLRQRWNFQLIASVISDDAEPLARAARPARLGILFGNEADGLAREEIVLCDRRVTIPMRMGTDSLNVAVAAGIFLHHFLDGCEEK